MDSLDPDSGPARSGGLAPALWAPALIAAVALLLFLFGR